MSTFINEFSMVPIRYFTFLTDVSDFTLLLASGVVKPTLMSRSLRFLGLLKRRVRIHSDSLVEMELASMSQWFGTI